MELFNSSTVLNGLEDQLLNQSGDTTTFRNLLSGKNFKYLDFFASWCVPCLQEFPYYATLIDEYKNDSISFIFISMDKSRKQWNAFSKRYNFLGSSNSYLLIDNFNSFFAKEYSIKKIPRHIILDSNNNLINSNLINPENNLSLFLKKYLRK